jgi:type I restriction enzyme S subunit
MDKQRKLAKVLWAMDDTKISYQKLLQKTDELVIAQFMDQFANLISDSSKCATLEEICEVFSDGDWIESKDQSEEGIRLIQTGNIGNGVFIDKGERARYINDETFERLRCTEVKPKDILVSRLPDPVGRACIIPEGLGKCITAVDCTILRLGDKVLPEFFVVYTLTPLYTSQIYSMVTGSTRKRVSRKNLGKVIIPIPELTSQEKFAAFVHQSDKSKIQLEQALAELIATFKKIISENLC